METVLQAHERECAVCTNDFNTPKILPCGHLLCRECVISWMDSKSDAVCPLCTCPIVEHQDKSSRISADVADALPTDSVMEAIVESAHVLVKDPFCCVCDDVKADFICMQCLDLMCQSCMKIHEKMAATRSHDVESLSTVTPERLAASRPALCADHGDKQAELFCADHRLSICASCSSKKHVECSQVRDLDDEMKLAENKLCSLTEILLNEEQNLKQALDQLNVRLQKVDATKQENMAQVDKTCDRIQKLVEDSRKKLKKLILDSSSKVENCLSGVKIELDKRLGQVTLHKDVVTRARAVAPRAALIHVTQALTDRVNNLDLNADIEAEVWEVPSLLGVRYCDDVVKRIETELQLLEEERAEAEEAFQDDLAERIKTKHPRRKQSTDPEVPVLVFHENCGANIRLMNNKTIAERTSQEETTGSGVVVSRDAMLVNVLYEVRVDAVDDFDCGMLALGVTSVPPAQLTMKTFSEELQDSVIIRNNMVSTYEKSFKVNFGKAFENIEVGSRVGVLVDMSGNLHLYVDGNFQGLAAEDVTQPCFAVFDVCNKVIQVTALPTSRRSLSNSVKQTHVPYLCKYVQHTVSLLGALGDALSANRQKRPSSATSKEQQQTTTNGGALNGGAH